jgi:hypothetical protein
VPHYIILYGPADCTETFHIIPERHELSKTFIEYEIYVLIIRTYIEISPILRRIQLDPIIYRNRSSYNFSDFLFRS